MKIGYVILAHDHARNVARLADRLLAADGVVSIHFDARKGPEPVEEIRNALGERDGRLLWPERIRVGWGEWSIVEATLNAVRAIFEAGHELDYIHLMSGADYPIRPLSDFAAFLERHKGTDFIEIEKESWVRDGLRRERYEFRHYFNFKRHPRFFEWNWKLQRMLRLRRRLPAGFTPHFGSQWCTLTAASWKAVLELADTHPKLVGAFRRSWIPDEMFVHTCLAKRATPSSSRHLTLYQFTDYGVPIVFCNGHSDYLAKQPFFFARKVSPYATALRDDLDKVLDGERSLRNFPDKRIGIATAEYENFRLRNRHGVEGRRIPGYSKDPWYGDLEWNRRPYVVFMGASREELDALAREIASLPGFVSHGRLFAKDAIHFATGHERMAGYHRSAIALRDHKQTNFLSDIIHATPDETCAFAIAKDEGNYISDVVCYDKRSSVVLVKGSALRSYCEMEDDTDWSRAQDQPTQDFESFCLRYPDYFTRQKDKLKYAKTRFLEIDLHHPDWRKELVGFLSTVKSDAVAKVQPNNIAKDRHIAQMLTRFHRPYLVLIGGSEKDLSLIARSLNSSNYFALHHEFSGEEPVNFATSANNFKSCQSSSPANHHGNPAGLHLPAAGGDDRRIPGFCIAGPDWQRTFGLVTHDPQARILVVKGGGLRAAPEFQKHGKGIAQPALGWPDPLQLEVALGKYRRFYADLQTATSQALGLAATVDLSKPGWPKIMGDFLELLDPHLANDGKRQVLACLRKAQASLASPEDPAAVEAHIRYLRSLIAQLTNLTPRAVPAEAKKETNGNGNRKPKARAKQLMPRRGQRAMKPRRPARAKNI